MRYRALVFVSFLLVSILSLPACSSWFKAKSPTTGQALTAEELKAELSRISAEQIGRERAAKQEAEEATRAAELKRSAALRDYRRASARIERKAAEEMQALTDTLEDTQAVTETEIAAATAALSATLETIGSERSRLDTEYAAALKEIDDKRAETLGVLTALEHVSSGLGPIGGLIGSAIGLGGLVFGLKGRRNAAELESSALSVIQAVENLKAVDPAVAASFTANANMLSERMGAGGKALVDKAQASA